MTNRIRLSHNDKYDLLLAYNMIGFISKDETEPYSLPQVFSDCAILTRAERKQLAMALMFDLLMEV